jgi:hypothetical protein
VHDRVIWKVACVGVEHDDNYFASCSVGDIEICGDVVDDEHLQSFGKFNFQWQLKAIFLRKHGQCTARDEKSPDLAKANKEMINLLVKFRGQPRQQVEPAYGQRAD